MPTDLRVVFPNRPGAVTKACEALADAGVNIRGFGGDIRAGEQWGYVHFLFDDPELPMTILEQVGLEVVDVHDVEVVEVEDRPGALVDVIRSYSERGENIEVLYTGAHNSIIVGTESSRRPRTGLTTEASRYQQKG